MYVFACYSYACIYFCMHVLTCARLYIIMCVYAFEYDRYEYMYLFM